VRVVLNFVNANVIHLFDWSITSKLAGILFIFDGSLICVWLAYQRFIALKNDQVAFANLALIILN